MQILRKFYRWFFLVLLVMAGIPLAILFLRSTVPTRGFTSRLITTWLNLLARLFGLKIKTYGSALNEKTLFVANHISWLDIFVLGGLVPMHFLSKHEVKSMPLLGWIATRAGTLYIKRGHGESASEASSEITKALKIRHNCLIFAEGTTTDGHTKKFHSRMMQSAIDAEALVQPVAIFYPKLDTETDEIISDPVTLFIGDTSMAESADMVFRAPRIDVEVHYLEPIDSTGKTRDEISRHAYNEVIAAIRLIKDKKDVNKT